MKKTLLFAAICAILLPAISSCAKKADEMKVMSFNVRVGSANDGENSWENRKEAIPAMLADKAPAVFGVQEALSFQLDYITETSPQYKWVGVGRDDGSNEGEHMSIFYDTNILEIEDWGTYWLSETPDVPSKGWDAACRRTATWALLKNTRTGKHFYFVNTHLDHVGVEARKNGLAMIVERIGAMNPENYPMVLTGDFNVHPDDVCLVDLDKIMKSARIYAEDSDDMYSFNGWGTSEQIIDYIYYSGFEKCIDFKVVDESYAEKPFISDHYPVIATLVF